MARVSVSPYESAQVTRYRLSEHDVVATHWCCFRVYSHRHIKHMPFGRVSALLQSQVLNPLCASPTPAHQRQNMLLFFGL